MANLLENVQKRRFFPTMTMPLKDDLPISQGQQKDSHLIGLRKRISSFSVKIQPISSSSSASNAWAFTRSKSMPSLTGLTAAPLRRWWDRSWAWVLSRKPDFARDLEMNEEETAMLGYQGKGSWRHVFFKVRAEIRKLIGSGSSLPTTHKFRYDSFNYAQNFDDGKSGAER